jgi:dTDP-4-amino-4,6-dideoxygalactose transaminase
MLAIQPDFFGHFRLSNMNVPFNDLALQHASLQPQLGEAIQKVIDDSSFIRGPHVEIFERTFAERNDVERCVSCANGTDALYIAMKGLGIKPGDEVITTAHSWISTSETITQAGGKVVFCDTDFETFTIDPDDIAAKITPRTVGIIPVHLYGHPAPMEKIMDLARTHNLWVIEDCAQAHLARIGGKLVGTFGNVGTFSFYPGKNLGAIGDAGCIVTNDNSLANWCEMYARHGGKGEHQIEGINSRMDGLQAAVLNIKLPHLDKWTNQRQKHAKKYDQLLSPIVQIQTPTVRQGADHVYHLYVIRSDHRDELKEHLSKHGVATALNYQKALPFYPAYSYLGHNHEDFPNAFRNQQSILSLPIFPEMKEEQISHICSTIASFNN